MAVRRRRWLTAIERVQTRGRSQKSSIARFHNSVLTDVFRVNNMRERVNDIYIVAVHSLHSYYCAIINTSLMT